MEEKTHRGCEREKFQKMDLHTKHRMGLVKKHMFEVEDLLISILMTCGTVAISRF